MLTMFLDICLELLGHITKCGSMVVVNNNELHFIIASYKSDHVFRPNCMQGNENLRFFYLIGY